MGERHKRHFQLAQEAEPTAERGGGETKVEERTSRSISQMYARAIATGEVQRAMVNKHQTHGDREAVIKALESAKKAPAYLEQTEIDKIRKSYEETKAKIESVGEKELIKQEISELKSKAELSALKRERDYWHDYGENKDGVSSGKV